MGAVHASVMAGIELAVWWGACWVFPTIIAWLPSLTDTF